MPRKWTEPIRPWPALNADRGYDVRIVAVDKVADPPGLKATLEFAEAEQAGRTTSVVLSLPCRPDGLLGLLPACGVDVRAGRRFAPRDLVGQVVRAFFVSRSDGDVVVARFEARPSDRTE